MYCIKPKARYLFHNQNTNSSHWEDRVDYVRKSKKQPKRLKFFNTRAKKQRKKPSKELFYSFVRKDDAGMSR